MPKTDNPNKRLKSYRLSEQALINIEVIRNTSGASDAAIIEMALAALAKGLTMNTPTTIVTKNVIAADTLAIKRMLIRDAKWRNERGQ